MCKLPKKVVNIFFKYFALIFSCNKNQTNQKKKKKPHHQTNKETTCQILQMVISFTRQTQSHCLYCNKRIQFQCNGKEPKPWRLHQGQCSNIQVSSLWLVRIPSIMPTNYNPAWEQVISYNTNNSTCRQRIPVFFRLRAASHGRVS